MKQKIFAALAASVMLCGVLTAPVSADSAYKKGDVNMDGVVDGFDAMLVLRDHVNYQVAFLEHTLTDEQIELANVTGITNTYDGRTTRATLEDAQCILIYYTECVADSRLKKKDITEWCKEQFPHLYARSEETQTAAAQETPADSVPAQNTEYLPGDVNMDGEIDIADANILMFEYNKVVIWGEESILTPQQIALGDVYPNTEADDLEDFISHLHSEGANDTRNPIMETDYPIGMEDILLIMDYYINMTVAHYRPVLGDMNVTEYAQYLGLLPKKSEKSSSGETVTMQGDTLPEDSVTIRDFGNYPVNPAGWTMLRAKLAENENFSLLYKGTDALADCRIIIKGFSGYTEDDAEYYENMAEEGTIQKLTAGDTAVFYDAKGIRDFWDDTEEHYNGKPSMIWFSGEHCIAVYTQKQYPDDIIQQIAESFAGYPAN